MSQQNPNFENKEGQKVPSVTFATRANDEWLNRTTEELFAGKTVVVFSLPGAFTIRNMSEMKMRLPTACV